MHSLDLFNIVLSCIYKVKWSRKRKNVITLLKHPFFSHPKTSQMVVDRICDPCQNINFIVFIVFFSHFDSHISRFCVISDNFRRENDIFTSESSQIREYPCTCFQPVTSQVECDVSKTIEEDHRTWPLSPVNRTTET